MSMKSPNWQAQNNERFDYISNVIDLHIFIISGISDAFNAVFITVHNCFGRERSRAFTGLVDCLF